MRSRIIILACVAFGFAVTCFSEGQSDWQSVVKNELHRYETDEDGVIFVLATNMGHKTFFAVPPKIAEILESHQRTELLPFLSELRQRAVKYSTESIIIEHCIFILNKGLHGRPDTVGRGVAPNARQVPVITFEYPY